MKDLIFPVLFVVLLFFLPALHQAHEQDLRKEFTGKSYPDDEPKRKTEGDRYFLKSSQNSALPSGRYLQVWNPQISVIGDFLGHYSSKENTFDEEFLLREIEFAFSSYVDPYARADIFLGVHKEIPQKGEGVEDGTSENRYELDIEEAYFTFLTWPFGLQAKLGRFLISFGKSNMQHLHRLPWTDYPLVIKAYFGEEGLASEGISFSWMLSAPWVHYMELTYEIFNNDQDILFGGHRGDDFVHLLHLKNYWDLTENSSLEMGLSGMSAPNDDKHSRHRTTLEGIDITFKWRPLRRGLYQSFIWQTELLFSQKDMTDSGQEDSWGGFTSWNYQFARRWSAGLRLDSSQYPDDSSIEEREYSGYITFAQSEYAFWRMGYSFLTSDIEDRNKEHQIFLQLNIGIGQHRAHQY